MILSNIGSYIGLTTSFRRTIGECDVYGFAGLTGDHHPNHVDEEYMRRTPYGTRIAHAALLLGYLSRASGEIAAQIQNTMDAAVVTYGFDRVRFTEAVRIGDTIELRYRVAAASAEEAKLFGDVEFTNQHRKLVCIARHILKIIPNSIDSSGSSGGGARTA
jgi:acyl dehydratase